jgi:hypothetical protein
MHGEAAQTWDAPNLFARWDHSTTDAEDARILTASATWPERVLPTLERSRKEAVSS